MRSARDVPQGLGARLQPLRQARESEFPLSCIIDNDEPTYRTDVIGTPMVRRRTADLIERLDRAISPSHLCARTTLRVLAN